MSGPSALERADAHYLRACQASERGASGVEEHIARAARELDGEASKEASRLRDVIACDLSAWLTAHGRDAEAAEVLSVSMARDHGFRCLRRSALAAARAGDMQGARDLLRQAIATSRTEHSPGGERWPVWLDIASIELALGDVAALQDSLIRALEEADVDPSVDRALIGSLAHALGRVLLHPDRAVPDRARPFLHRALALAVESSGRESPEAASVLKDLALAEAIDGNPAVSERLLFRARAIEERLV
jgi:hypothetical protein